MEEVIKLNLILGGDGNKVGEIINLLLEHGIQVAVSHSVLGYTIKAIKSPDGKYQFVSKDQTIIDNEELETLTAVKGLD